MPAGLIETIDARAAAVTDVKAASEALRQQLGADQYDQLVDQAKIARPTLGAAAADLFSLKMLAANGRYLAAYQRTKPGAKP